MSKQIRIFVAEDNPADVDLIEEALREHGIDYALQLADDGQKVSQFLESLHSGGQDGPDVILMDLNLPKASGFELLGRFRSHPRCVGTPIIVVTSSDASRDRDRARELGASRYFRKPSELADFMRLGELVLETLAAAEPSRQDC